MSGKELLKQILFNMRYVNPATIERFLNNYTLAEERFDEKPHVLLNYMQHMFGPGQGASAFELFKELRE